MAPTLLSDFDQVREGDLIPYTHGQMPTTGIVDRVKEHYFGYSSITNSRKGGTVSGHELRDTVLLRPNGNGGEVLVGEDVMEKWATTK